MSPKVSTEDSEDRRRRTRAASDNVRGQAARAIRIVCGVLATVLALGAILVVLRSNINEQNEIVKFVLDLADGVSGPFSRDGGIFKFTGKGSIPKNALLNWGIAAIVWLLIGRFLSGLIAPKSTR